MRLLEYNKCKECGCRSVEMKRDSIASLFVQCSGCGARAQRIGWRETVKEQAIEAMVSWNEVNDITGDNEGYET